MRGKIKLESKENEFTKWTIKIPMEIPEKNLESANTSSLGLENICSALVVSNKRSNV